MQGGPHNHTIGGLAVCLKYAQSPDFKDYQNKVIRFSAPHSILNKSISVVQN